MKVTFYIKKANYNAFRQGTRVHLAKKEAREVVAIRADVDEIIMDDNMVERLMISTDNSTVVIPVTRHGVNADDAVVVEF